jgi:hypothetical protein
MPDTTPQADAGSKQTHASVPIGAEPFTALPSRPVFRHQPSDWRAPAWIPTDPDVLTQWTTPSFLETVTSGKVGAHDITEAAPR